MKIPEADATSAGISSWTNFRRTGSGKAALAPGSAGVPLLFLSSPRARRPRSQEGEAREGRVSSLEVADQDDDKRYHHGGDPEEEDVAHVMPSYALSLRDVGHNRGWLVWRRFEMVARF